MRKLALFSFAFGGAMLAVRYLLPAGAVLPLAVICALLGLGAGLAKRRPMALVLCGLSAALAWSVAYDGLVRAPARALEYQTTTLTAEVAAYPRATTRGVSVAVTLNPGAQVLLYLEPEHQDLEPGDVLTFTASFRPSDLVRGEETDSYTSRGMFLIAYPKGPIEVTHPGKMPWYCWPAAWGRALKESVGGIFPPDVAHLVTAVLTGDKAGMPGEDYAALQRTGVAHAVAVSGMHVGYLATMLFGLSGRYKKRTAVVAIPLLVGFMLLTGASPSVVRAVLMQSVLLMAPLLGRESDAPTSLGAALLILLVQNPYAAASVSLQLSFASVAGILFFSQRAYQRLWKPFPWKNKATRYGFISLATTLGALALTLPLLAYYFGSVSLIAPLANILVLWAVSFLFVGGLIAAGVGIFCLPMGLALAALVAPLGRYVLLVTHGLARAPFAAVTLSSGYLTAWAAFGYGLFLLWLLWRGEKKRLIVPLCCGTVTLCAALLLTRLSYESGPLTVTVLDVGQGESVVLRAGNRTALVDCGGNERRNAGDLAADYLSDRGRGTVDLFILTHFHADHANGVLEFLERVPVSVLAVPVREAEDILGAEILAAAQDKGIQIVTVEEDMTLPLGTAELTLYAPLGAGAANEAGLSVLCRTGGFSALFTGDMDGNVEKRLVKYGALPDVDLLMAGHHGSGTSTSPLLLAEITPEVVTCSVGYNTYGHPDHDTMARVADAGADLYRTDLQGNITITVR